VPDLPEPLCRLLGYGDHGLALSPEQNAKVVRLEHEHPTSEEYVEQDRAATWVPPESQLPQRVDGAEGVEPAAAVGLGRAVAAATLAGGLRV
jgi:hypothetical protein